MNATSGVVRRMRSEEEIRKVYEVAVEEWEHVKHIRDFYVEKVAQKCNILEWILNDKEEK